MANTGGKGHKKPWSAARKTKQAANYLKALKRKEARRALQDTAAAHNRSAGITPWAEAQFARRERRAFRRGWWR